MFKRILKWLILLIFFLLVSFGILLYLAIDTQPTIAQNYQLNSLSAQKSKQLLQRSLAVLKHHQKASQIKMSQEELNGLSALFSRAIPSAASEVTLSNERMNLSLSLEVPILHHYLNIHTQILSSQTGLELTNINIGSLSFSGKIALRIVRWTLNHYVQAKLGDTLFTMVQSVTINNQICIFTLKLPQNLITANKDGSLLLTLRDELNLFGDPNVIRSYYQELVRVSATAPKQTSLAFYFRHLFQFAQQRHLLFEDETVSENQAALLALALYFGTDKFELLVGEISQLDNKKREIRTILQRQTLLQGRSDLQKHFIYSVALQIFSSLHASDAIGEFKEFLDSNKGGSGFSFADLMADRAGTRLAKLATSSQDNAIKVQNLLATITDDTLLPSIKGLPEGLSSKRFEAKYKAIHTKEYQVLLSQIDQKLNQLMLYKLLE
ncbi:hypothetical protein ACOYR1_06710 [Thalassotalea piscium]